MAVAQMPKTPNAPPVYRPQSVPGVLQTKKAAMPAALSPNLIGRRAVSAPAVYYPNVAPAALQRKSVTSSPEKFSGTALPNRPVSAPTTPLASRVSVALQRKAEQRNSPTTPSLPTRVSRMTPPTGRVVQRTVNWGQGNEDYFQSAPKFLSALYQAYPQSSAFVSSYPNLHVPPSETCHTQKLEGFNLKSYSKK
jgi:hypothetical protein